MKDFWMILIKFISMVTCFYSVKTLPNVIRKLLKCNSNVKIKRWTWFLSMYTTNKIKSNSMI